MASLDDILTTQKNGVVAINGLVQGLTKIYTNFRNIRLFAGAAATSATAIYTTPNQTTSACITDIMIVNTGTTTATFTINLVPFGGTADATNAIFYASAIPPGTSVQWTGNQAISGGGFVSAYASSTSVTFMVSGVLST